MKPIDYFKLQAKNLLKDYQTKFPVYDSVIDDYLNDYKPKYFDLGWILLDFDIDDEKQFTLMNEQHIIAQLAGFYKWADMLKATEVQLELGKLLFDNSNKISVLEWNDYLAINERDNNVTFDDETRLEIFTMVFANVDGHESMMVNYRLNPPV